MAASTLWWRPGRRIFLWGWGSLDMKSGIAMMLHAILRAKTDGMTSAGDIVLALVSDEESGGDQGGR
ncbi:MAG: M20 family metallopeptidase [SAR202 cluster bacterium]|nr:M20 family metallopeptidase [SAR202 cluster bacterium]